MTRKQASSKQQAASSTGDTLVATWRVFGNRKSNRVFTAALATGVGTPGARVVLTAKSGAITFGNLVEVHAVDQDSKQECWSFAAEVLTPEQRAANRAAKAVHTAAYWQSDAGVETARKIAARQALKASEQASEGAAVTPETPAPAAPVTSTPAAPVTMPTLADLIAANLAAGLDAVAAVTTAQAALAALTTAPAAPAPATRTLAPRNTSTAAPAAPGEMGTCECCNMAPRHLSKHPSGLKTCKRCASLDVDTAKVRAARHQGVK